MRDQREVIAGLKAELLQTTKETTSTVKLKRVVVDKNVDAPSIPLDEADELVTMLETKEEALELCQESGIVVDSSVSMSTMEETLTDGTRGEES